MLTTNKSAVHGVLLQEAKNQNLLPLFAFPKKAIVTSITLINVVKDTLASGVATCFCAGTCASLQRIPADPCKIPAD